MPTSPANSDTIQWLLEGDPAIRWQVMRDLLDAPEAQWQAEREQMQVRGWAAQMLARQNPDGGWGEGVYSPKWTSTTYTLLSLREMGLPRENPQAQRGTQLMLAQMLGEQYDAAFQQRVERCDRCIVGMILELAVYFGADDARVEALVANLLAERMPEDGAWNCRRAIKPYPHHSSFHTTLNVLDGLRDYLELRPGAPQAEQAAEAERGAQEFLLAHRLFRSDKTGAVIHENFTKMAYPYRWYYDFLRGLETLARTRAPRDPRMQDAIDLLHQRQGSDGRWPNQKKYSGRIFFTLEPARQPSRWNTLRALRVQKWWQESE
jgi:hypothetical protein